PFVRNQIEVVFYNVYFEGGKRLQYNINPDLDCDIFFAMSYFGIEEFQNDSILKHFKEKGTVIVEDITHRLLNKESYSVYTQYSIASLRKWFPIVSGGLIMKHEGNLNVKPNLDSNDLIEGKKQAMKQKTKYLRGEDIDKSMLLKTIAEFDLEFGKSDYRYKIDNFSLEILEKVDVKLVQQKRRNNARLLYNAVKNLKHINFLIPKSISDNSTPLFLPVMMENNKRDNLRSFLIQHNVYCPIHWPNTELNSSSISNNELSLVCDQRYSDGDMVYIIELLEQWHGRFT